MSKERTSKKQLAINLIAALMNFIVVAGINFVLTPLLSKELGDEAYGFIGLANNFASYASILSVALNSMSARFISIEFHKGNTEKAKEYFNSVFIADLIMGIFLTVVSVFIIFNITSIVNISSNLVLDVQITFGIVFANTIVTIINSVYGVAVFVVNRLDLNSIRLIISKMINILVLLILFFLFKPKIFYISIATIIATIFVSFENIKLTHRLIPELNINFRGFKLKAVKEIISSGIWNAINHLSSLLLTGLDLIIANLFIDSKNMGILSVAKTIPSAFLALLGTISNIFTPVFTTLYAQGKKEELVKEVKFSIKVFSLIMTVPIIGFIVFGYEFYSLWMPYRSSEEIMQIQILSILTLAPNIFSSYIYSLYSINTVTNKLKVPVLLTMGISILSTITVLILVNTTNLGVYAVAGVSSFYLILRILFFVPTYAAHNLELPLFTFYKPFLRAIGCSGILAIAFWVIKSFITIDSWADLIFIGFLAGVTGYILNIILLLNNTERNQLKGIIKEKFVRGK